MLITELKISRFDNSQNKLKGVVTITLDDMFVIRDIKILFAKEHKFLAMPSKVLPNKNFIDIVHPINKMVRDVIEKLVFDAYQKCEEEGKQYMHFVIREDLKTSSFEDLKIDFYYTSKENSIVDVRRKKDDVQSHVENRKNASQDDTILNWLKL